MRPYTLKRDILYHAIQGKLVPQVSSEGSGQNLVIENNRRRANYPLDIQKRIGKGCKPIQETELLFDIPDNWAWERFGNLVINYDSQRKPVTKSDRKNTHGLFDYYGATGAIDKVDEYIFDGEYLMIGEDGGNFFVDRDNSFIARGAFWANNHVHVVKPIICDIEYLKLCLDAYDLPNLGLINGIAVPKLNQEKMNSILVPLPPLAEQKRIVAKIEELLPLIDRYEAAWSRLEEFNKRFPGNMQKSLLQMAIQGKLVEQRPEEGTGEELFKQIQAEKQSLIKAGKIKKEKPMPEITEDEIPFEIPESWKWVRLLSVVEIATNLVQPAEYLDYMHIAPDNIEKGTGKLLECKTVAADKVASANHLFYQGQIIYSKIRPLLRKAVIAPFDGLCSADMYPLNTKLEPVFLLHFLLSDAFNHQIALAMSSRVKMPKINQDELGKVLLPLPPLAEQKRIVAKLEELLPLCERLK